MMNIKTIILQGGMEIIADVEETRNWMAASGGAVTTYRLNKPFRVLPVPIQLPKQTPQGVAIEIQISPQMVPLMASTIQSYIEVEAKDIVGAPMDVNKQFESVYVQRTTGLQLA
jgi:hypothetical protein